MHRPSRVTGEQVVYGFMIVRKRHHWAEALTANSE